MKKLILIYIVFFCAAVTSAQNPKWTNPNVWKLQLQKYMTAVQVQSLLGDPVDREISAIAMQWYYQQGPTRLNGKVTERPTLGVVKFKMVKINPITNQRLPQPLFAVFEFAEPDWDQAAIDFPAPPEQTQEPEDIEPPAKEQKEQPTPAIQQQKTVTEQPQTQITETPQPQQDTTSPPRQSPNNNGNLSASQQTLLEKIKVYAGDYFLIIIIGIAGATALFIYKKKKNSF